MFKGEGSSHGGDNFQARLLVRGGFSLQGNCQLPDQSIEAIKCVGVLTRHGVNNTYATSKGDVVINQIDYGFKKNGIKEIPPLLTEGMAHVDCCDNSSIGLNTDLVVGPVKQGVPLQNHVDGMSVADCT